MTKLTKSFKLYKLHGNLKLQRPDVHNYEDENYGNGYQLHLGIITKGIKKPAIK
jgi:hypothetical protein